MFKKRTNIAIVAWIILSLVASDVFAKSRGNSRSRSVSRHRNSSRTVGRGHIRPRNARLYRSHRRARPLGRSRIVYRPSSRFSIVLSSGPSRRSCGHYSSCACSTRQPQHQADITVWINNRNGSKTPVKLKVEGAWYVGPRGEYYWERPTEEQLRPLYGLNAR